MSGVRDRSFHRNSCQNMHDDVLSAGRIGRVSELSDAEWIRLGQSVSARSYEGEDADSLRGLGAGWSAAISDRSCPRSRIFTHGTPLLLAVACLALAARGRPLAEKQCKPEESAMRAVAISTLAFCASNAVASSAVVGWGRNDFGQASPPLGLGNSTKFAVGLYHNLALQPDGSVVAWGWNEAGQCNVPADLGHVVALEAGYKHSATLDRAGVVRCFGANDVGQCDVPPKLGFVKAIGVGDEFTLAVQADGAVRAWGLNSSGQTNVPASLTGVVHIAGGAAFALAQRADGSVVAWGRNDWGQCDVPATLGTVVDVVGGAWHSIALRSDRTVMCWGRNEYGQTDVPADLGPVVQISGDRGNVTMVLLADGTVRHWGQWNEVWTNPTPPSKIEAWREIACGGYHAIGAPVRTPCPGDLNDDGVADSADLAILLSSWGACP